MVSRGEISNCLNISCFPPYLIYDLWWNNFMSLFFRKREKEKQFGLKVLSANPRVPCRKGDILEKIFFKRKEMENPMIENSTTTTTASSEIIIPQDSLLYERIQSNNTLEKYQKRKLVVDHQTKSKPFKIPIYHMKIKIGRGSGGPCQYCRVTETPEWRVGPNNTRLCNACGLRYH